MYDNYITHSTDSTSVEKESIDFVNIFTRLESSSSLDELQKILDSIKSDSPQTRDEVFALIRFILVQKTWDSSSHFERDCFSLHLSGSRSTEKMVGIPKGQFIYTHTKKAELAGCCKRTMERSNIKWERSGCIKTAIRKRISRTKTVNFYHKDKLLNQLRVVDDQYLFINYVSSDGIRSFVPLTVYIDLKIKELKKPQESNKDFFEKPMQFVRECRPNYSDSLYVNNSNGDSQNFTKRKQISEYMKDRISRGILHKDLSYKIKLRSEDIPKFDWFTDAEIEWAFDAVQNMKLETFDKLKNPAHYMLAVCKNKRDGVTQWKQQRPQMHLAQSRS